MTDAGVRCICVTGPESTGKTTLAQQLATALDAECVPEVARLYAERVARELTVQDVESIAHEHMALADAALARAAGEARPFVVLDTDLVSTIVYGRHYYDHESVWLREEALRRRASQYLLCEPDLPWVPDGIRDQPAGGHKLFRDFAEVLRSLDARVCRVSGRGDLRFRSAMTALASL